VSYDSLKSRIDRRLHQWRSKARRASFPRPAKRGEGQGEGLIVNSQKQFAVTGKGSTTAASEPAPEPKSDSLPSPQPISQ
jgi:hypothetical protein